MKVLLVILIAFGVTSIYDARDITNKYFASQDQNQMTLILKIIGAIISIISGIILCNVMWLTIKI